MTKRKPEPEPELSVEIVRDGRWKGLAALVEPPREGMLVAHCEDGYLYLGGGMYRVPIAAVKQLIAAHESLPKRRARRGR